MYYHFDFAILKNFFELLAELNASELGSRGRYHDKAYHTKGQGPTLCIMSMR
jgi:hypothetical protein